MKLVIQLSLTEELKAILAQQLPQVESLEAGQEYTLTVEAADQDSPKADTNDSEAETNGGAPDDGGVVGGGTKPPRP